MFGMNGNAIQLTRGNSAVIQIELTDTETGNAIVLSDGESVLFTVKKLYGNKVMQKTLTASDHDSEDETKLNLILEPDDTIPLVSGEYKYDCLYLTSDGQAVTFISSTLTITEAFGVYTDIGGEGD